ERTGQKEAEAGQKDAERDFVAWIRHLVAVRKTCNTEEVQNSLAHGLRASLKAGVGLVGDILTTLPAAPA
ncbi:MAG TPA: hypothetical protein VJ910_12675, partial [Desulfuromonadales bacterium]|nr:hypothetical protein [Desulfuromonadales bacterium]